MTPNIRMTVCSLAILTTLSGLSLQAQNQDSRRFEIFGGYSYMGRDRVDAHGWNQGWAVNITRWFSAVVETSVHFDSEDRFTSFDGSTILRLDVDRTFTTFLAGGRFSVPLRRLRPFFRVTGGFLSINSSIDFPQAFPSGSLGGFDGDVRLTENQTHGAVSVGAGLDIPIKKHLAIRAIQADAIVALVGGGGFGFARISTGLVYYF